MDSICWWSPFPLWLNLKWVQNMPERSLARQGFHMLVSSASPVPIEGKFMAMLCAVV